MLVLPALLGTLAALTQEPIKTEWRSLDALTSSVPYGVDYWGVREGLPQVQVNALTVDPGGLIYVGTHTGLASFDGAQFEPIRELAGRNLQTMRIESLCFDAQGRLWIGTGENGVGILDRDESRWLDAPEGFGDVTSVREIALGPQGSIWIGCAEGVIEYSSNGVPGRQLRLPQINDLAFHRDGSVLIAGQKLWRLREDQVEVIYPNLVTSVLAARDGTVWAGDRNTSLLRLEADGSWTGWRHRDEGGVHEIFESEDGTIWFGARNPIEFREGNFYTALSDGRERPNLGIATNDLLRDREGTIWLGGGGLTGLQERPLWALQIPPFRGDTPRIVLEDRFEPGTLWVGQYSGALSRMKLNREFERWNDASADSLATGPDSATYAASEKFGLQRLTANEATTVIDAKDTLPGRALALLPDGPQGWWMSADASLQHFDAQRNRTIWGIAEGLDLGEIHTLALDSRGDLWIGAKRGAAVLSNQTIVRVLRSGESIASGPVRAIHHRENGTVWLGHNGGGLSVQRSDGTWQMVAREQGLHENVVHTILGDSDGGMTMLGNQGLSRFSPEDLRNFENGTSARLMPRVFDQAPGAPVFEGMGGAMPAGSRMASGDMIFAAFQHLIWFHAERATRKLPEPIVQLKPMMIDNRYYDPSQQHELETDFRALVVGYYTTSVTDRHLLRYQRQLVGHDKDWIDVGNSEIAHYSNLAPGTYRFRVRAANRDGVWSKVIESAPLHFAPRLTEMAWFRGTLVCGVLALVSAVVFLRFRTQRQTSQALARLVDDRTADLQAARNHLKSEVSSRTKDLQQALDQLQLDMGEREQLREQLRRAERLEALGLVTSGVAHEFNNLLTVVLGEAEVGRANAVDDELRQRMSRILNAGNQAAELTDEMLRFSRSVPRPETAVYFDTEVCRAADLTLSLMPQGVRPTLSLQAERARVRINPAQLGVIVMNLALNARDASARDAKIHIRTEADGSTVRLVVEDEGTGIPADLHEKIFEPFFSTKDPDAGSGFGLASVKSAVERAQGSIQVESEVGRGTRFIIEFPQVGGAQHDQLTLLLCDDEPGVLEVVQGLLADEPMQILTAHSPREAVALAKDFEGRIDVLMTDSVMPGMNGDELAATIRALYPEIRVGFISGYSRTGLHASGASEIRAPFLSKPFRPEELRAFVEELINSLPEPAVQDSP